MTKRSDEHRERYTERLLGQVSDTNRPLAQRYLSAKRAQGLKPASLMNVALYMRRLDTWLDNQPLEKIEPQELTRLIEGLTRSQSPNTIYDFCVYTKGFYRWLHDDELPKEFRLALKRMPKLEFADRVPVTEEERDQLLAAADEGIMRHPAARRKALIWLLWDSGFRISEAISLRISDVHFDDRGGANLRLRPGTPGLKTGARTVYVVDCVGPLKLWLAFHPYRDDPEAAVFNSRNDPREPMWPSNAATMLKQFSHRAGIRHMHPHLFRHTRATRAAEAGWNEPQMRAYFGWGKTSHMPAHYIHLSQRNMEDRVRQDAGIEGTGRRVGAKPSVPVDAEDMDKRLKKALRRLLLDD